MFEANRARFREGFAALLGCSPGDFDSHSLVVVPRPPSDEPYLAAAVTFGTGTVVSVVPEYLDIVREQAPSRHYRVFYPPAMVAALVDEGKHRGVELGWRGPNLSFVSAEIPPEPMLPAGIRASDVDRDWRARYLDGGHFDNALGEVGTSHVDSLWQRGIALIDEDDEPAAVAGAFQDVDGVVEIGVDVVRGHREGGLGRAVVALMARSIIDAGAVPSYYCAPTNVRSHRTALSCGFLPVASVLWVNVSKPAAGS